MNTQVEDAARRARVLLSALTALLECCQLVEDDSSQLAGCVFLCVELSDAIEKLTGTPSVVPAND